MIAIVNYGSGNIRAICNIYSRINVPFLVVERPEQLQLADRILLPGVGSFDQAMGELERSGLRMALEENVHGLGKPILGICVGMQLLAERSEEGAMRGLGWIPGEVMRFEKTRFGGNVRLPHMGWNNVEPKLSDSLFRDVDIQNGFYFLHSYYFRCADDCDELAYTDYGGRYASAIKRGNVYGVQFHPEKSHSAGVALLKNFALSVGSR